MSVEIQSQSFTGCAHSNKIHNNCVDVSISFVDILAVLSVRCRGYKAATLGQWFLDRIKLGQLLPVQSLYVLRGNIEVWEAIGDLVRALCVNSYAPKAI